MRRVLIGAIVLVAAFAVVLVVRRGSTLPVSAVLAYEFKAGTTATYDVSLVVTNTVSGGAAPSTSHTAITVATHASVLSTDRAGAGLLRVSVDQPTMTVDGVTVPATLTVTTAQMRIFPDGRVEAVTFPGASHSVAILSGGSKKTDALKQVGTVTAQGGNDPLQSILLLAQGSVPAMPGGTLNVGDHWSHPSLINIPYMLLEQAIASSKLDGFERDEDLNVARVSTDSTAPVDLQTYQSSGSPLHLQGTQHVHILSYVAADLHVLLRTAGQGHVDIVQTVSAGPSTAKVGGLTVSTPPVHTVTDLSFTARLRRS